MHQPFAELALLLLIAAAVGALGVRLRQRGFSVRFGDGEDAAFMETLPLATADSIVTTLPNWEANQALLHAMCWSPRAEWRTATGARVS